MTASLLLIVTLEAYLLGSIPFGLLASKVTGVDVRQHGSGNIGATNVLRVLGKPWGIAVFTADTLKGLTAVRVAYLLVALYPDAEVYADFYAILAAAACVAGHSFPVWLRFKGGKGVATSLGALLGVVPIAAVSIFLVWVVVFKTTRYVSLASVLAALSLPIVVLFLGHAHGRVVLYFTMAMTLLVVWRHRSNISRLLDGTEPRFKRP
ncbi:MAG: glycerol-3-phosphate 1-O-acyltransferase PlsY [Chthoniobacterales bacterium]